MARGVIVEKCKVDEGVKLSMPASGKYAVLFFEWMHYITDGSMPITWVYRSVMGKRFVVGMSSEKAANEAAEYIKKNS